MAKASMNISASVRQRLLNLAREDGRDFQTVLVAFGLERLIYRLSISEFRDRFVLKGGMLVTLWAAEPAVRGYLQLSPVRLSESARKIGYVTASMNNYHASEVRNN